MHPGKSAAKLGQCNVCSFSGLNAVTELQKAHWSAPILCNLVCADHPLVLQVVSEVMSRDLKMEVDEELMQAAKH